MAHFASINEAGIVTDVIAINNSDCGDLGFPASEPEGQAFIASLCLPGRWVQTSYSASFRVRYAGVGFIFDAVNGAFIPPRPYPSWMLNSEFDWEPPIPYPAGVGLYTWDEASRTWRV